MSPNEIASLIKPLQGITAGSWRARTRDQAHPSRFLGVPPLTTVHPDFAEVGRQCITVMLDPIHVRPRSGMRVVVLGDLIVRCSSCPPARA
ncbi:hypothetical protein [Streptomyces sp. NPDC050164]|uniref:hypothetical protein n=1 Tax=Streptomyces sp. NPDC050164 TaxID=3365605 RepID=UPI003791BC81